MSEVDPTSLLLVNRSNNTEDYLPAVEEYFQMLGARIRARLVNRTSANFVVNVVSVEALPLDGLKQGAAFGPSAIYSLLRLDKGMNAGGFALQRSLLTRIIGAMLGDDGDEEGVEAEAEEENGEPRSLSPVEARIARRLMVDLIADISKAWPVSGAPDVSLENGPGNPRVIDPASGLEETYIATLSLGTEGDDYGQMAVAVPVQVLRGLSGPPKLDPDAKRDERTPKMSRVHPVEVDVVAEMARLPMRVRDLHRLRIGDLVPLGPITGALVRVNGRAIFRGEPGHQNGQRSIRVRARNES